MRNFRKESDKPSTLTSPSAKASTEPTGPPPIYRTCLAIAVVVVCGIIIAIVAMHSGSSSRVGNGGRSPRAIVFVVEGLRGPAIEAAMLSNKAPTIQRIRNQGSSAECGTANAATCATTTSAIKRPSAVAGFETILTGVTPDVHKVTNFSDVDLLPQSLYSSFLFEAKKYELRPAVVGPYGMVFSESSLISQDLRCLSTGLVDAECIGSACTQGTTSCNTAFKAPFRGGFSGEQYDAAVEGALDVMEENSDLVLVYLDATAGGSITDFRGTSMRYLSEIYRVDALIGQVLEAVVDRTVMNQENWMVLVTSNYGGVAAAPAQERETVGFAMAAYGKGRPYDLKPLVSPVSVADVYPTLATWFGMTVNRQVSGKSQGLCSDGIKPKEGCA